MPWISTISLPLVAQMGAKIGRGSNGSQSPFAGLDTSALGIHSPIPPVFAKGGRDALWYYGVVKPLRLNDTGPVVSG